MSEESDREKQDNLDLWIEAKHECLNLKDLRDLYSFFVGALQSHVPKEVWQQAINTAKECVRNTRAVSSV